MKKIRFIQLGGRVTTLLSNLVIKLSEIQSEYQFELSYRSIRLNRLQNGKGYYDKYLFKLIMQYMIDNDFDEYPIGFTDRKLVDELVSINDHKGAIISTYPLKKYSNSSIEKASLYTIAGILPDIEHQVTAVHDSNEVRGCPNDFCENFADIDIGIDKGEYCPECHQKFLEAIENHELSCREMASIYRILDYVAGRNLCFVIMPFKREFNHIYTVVKRCLSDLNYECSRGDKIFETRNVLDIINERIIRSNLIIADLTNRNPNVFYELGIAHANAKQSILLAQKPTDIPFDLRHRQRIIYRPGKHFEKNIKKHLAKYVKKK